MSQVQDGRYTVEETASAIETPLSSTERSELERLRVMFSTMSIDRSVLQQQQQQ